jgi:hypothetical protein
LCVRLRNIVVIVVVIDVASVIHNSIHVIVPSKTFMRQSLNTDYCNEQHQ